jgi:probable 2-oxoglutarate dehydrogenase E1 component DHKTD1
VSFLKTLFAKASELDVEQVVLGMPHRGRLNVLCNLLDYPPQDLFRKIMGNNDLPDEWATGIDDVVSHISISAKKSYSGTGNTR